jgi:hypothetical protein
MARKQGPNVVVDTGTAADTRLTENEWWWIKVLRIICDNQVPAPNFPATMSMKAFFGSRESDGH